MEGPRARGGARGVRPDQVVKALVELTLSTGYPVPAPRDVVYSWARGSGLPRRGRVYLFTGALYQLVPYIEATVEYMKRGGGLAGLAAGLASRLGRLAGLALRPRRELLEWSRRVLLSIARLAAGSVEGLAYLYERDAYSGIILYDVGAEEAFQAHAERVCRALREAGAERLIVPDPHTLYALRELYPRYVDGCSLEARSYLELLDPEAVRGRAPGVSAAVHEPCLYARRLGVLEAPRRLLEAAGVEARYPPRSGAWTGCCGGPVEAFAPSLAEAVAVDRLQELFSTGTETVVTMCPICFVNLSRASRRLGRGRLVDISEVLSGNA